MTGIKGIIAKVASSSAGDIVNSVVNAVDTFVQTPEEKAQARQAIEAEINRHTESMAETMNKELELTLKDNDSARSREIQIATSHDAPKLNKMITPILALMIVGLTFAMWWAVLYKEFRNDNKDVVLFVLGSLSTMSAGVVAYYFGSSSSSKTKQETIERLLK